MHKMRKEQEGKSIKTNIVNNNNSMCSRRPTTSAQLYGGSAPATCDPAFYAEDPRPRNGFSPDGAMLAVQQAQTCDLRHGNCGTKAAEVADLMLGSQVVRPVSNIPACIAHTQPSHAKYVDRLLRHAPPAYN